MDDYSVSMLRANILMILFEVPILAVLASLFALAWGWSGLGDGIAEFLNLSVFLPVFLVGIVAHELIHAVAWGIAASRPLRSIKIGFQFKTLTPYAHSTDPMPVTAYRLGTVMPTLLLGIVPSMVALLTGSGVLMTAGLFFTLAGGGDILILWLIRRVPAGKLVLDHPTKAGCFVLS